MARKYAIPNCREIVADTENNVPRATFYEDDNFEPAEGTLSTHPWIVTWAPVKEDLDDSDAMWSKDMDGFFDFLRRMPSGTKVFFHNLKYDGPSIVHHMETVLSYTLDRSEDDRRNPPRSTYRTTISDSNVWYQMRVTLDNGVSLRFEDSYKKLPFKVEDIAESFKTKYQKLVGTIDYQKQREVGYDPTDTEIKYAVNDVLVMAEAMAKLKGSFPTLYKSLTIGSACMKDYRLTLGKGDPRRGREVYDYLFPQLEELDKPLRKGYRGAFCSLSPNADPSTVYVFPGARKGHRYDVNSLYPSVMLNPIPYGDPFKIRFDDVRADGTAPYAYFIDLQASFKVKPGHIPFLQIKGTSRFADNQYVTEGDSERLTLTGVDYQLMLEQYDVEVEIVYDVWAFETSDSLFSEYILKWYEIKNQARKDGDVVMYLVSKLMLNNLYGKMAQSAERFGGELYLDEDGVFHLREVPGEGPSGHIGAGAYITAYARAVTVRAAQANYDIFLYADTDSIHTSDVAAGIDVDAGRIGAWKHEAALNMMRFVRQKTYIEREIDGAETKIDIKAAGAPDAVKTRLLYKVTDFDGEWHARERIRRDDEDNITNAPRSDDEVFARFSHGLTEFGKLRQRQVVGGTILEETTFKIHPQPGYDPDPVTGLAPTVFVEVL